MPITYDIDTSVSLIITRCVGPVTLAEVRAHFQELARVWPKVDCLHVLLDLTDQTSLPTLPELEAVATEMGAQIGPWRFGRCAVVTEQESLHISMKMFEVLAGRYFDAVEVFRTGSDAITWLFSKTKGRPCAGLPSDRPRA